VEGLPAWVEASHCLDHAQHCDLLVS
jgi:hypothetical protein